MAVQEEVREVAVHPIDEALLVAAMAHPTQLHPLTLSTADSSLSVEVPTVPSTAASTLRPVQLLH